MSTKQCQSSNLQLKKVAFYGSKRKSYSNASNLILDSRCNNNTSINRYQPSITFFNNDNCNQELPLKIYSNNRLNHNSDNKKKKCHRDKKKKIDISCPLSYTCEKSNNRLLLIIML